MHYAFSLGGSKGPGSFAPVRVDPEWDANRTGGFKYAVARAERHMERRYNARISECLGKATDASRHLQLYA